VMMALGGIGIANPVIARSACDEAIQFFLVAFWIAHMGMNGSSRS
jgi:hypothetical protein